MYRQRRKCGMESWHRSSMPPCIIRRSGNQMVMIKVRHTDHQLYAGAKRAQSDFMEGINCKKYQRVLKSEIEFQCPRWPLSVAVSAGYS